MRTKITQKLTLPVERCAVIDVLLEYVDLGVRVGAKYEASGTVASIGRLGNTTSLFSWCCASGHSGGRVEAPKLSCKPWPWDDESSKEPASLGFPFSLSEDEVCMSECNFSVLQGRSSSKRLKQRKLEIWKLGKHTLALHSYLCDFSRDNQ